MIASNKQIQNIMLPINFIFASNKQTKKKLPLDVFLQHKRAMETLFISMEAHVMETYYSENNFQNKGTPKFVPYVYILN